MMHELDEKIDLKNEEIDHKNEEIRELTAKCEAQVVENATLKETNASLVTAKTKLKIEVAQLKEKLRSCKSNGTSRAVCLTYC